MEEEQLGGLGQLERGRAGPRLWNSSGRGFFFWAAIVKSILPRICETIRTTENVELGAVEKRVDLVGL